MVKQIRYRISLKFTFILENMAKSLISPLPDDKILHWSKFKQIADDILIAI